MEHSLLESTTNNGIFRVTGCLGRDGELSEESSRDREPCLGSPQELWPWTAGAAGRRPCEKKRQSYYVHSPPTVTRKEPFWPKHRGPWCFLCPNVLESNKK